MLQHVTIETPAEAVEACAEFYALLGFRRVEPPLALAGRSTWFERDGTQVHLTHTDEPVVPPRAHFAVVLEPFQAGVERLRAAGFEVRPADQQWGAPRAFVHDPAGHRVEVMAAPPASS